MNYSKQKIAAAVVVALMGAASAAQASIANPAPSVTLESLLVPGATYRVYDPSISCADVTFYNFHNVTQVGDLNVPLSEIFVSEIWGGPGTSENEPGIRFSSALWTLAGASLHYDLGLDFHVRQTDLLNCLKDNTLEFTGGFNGTGSASVAEGVINANPPRNTLATKLVYFDALGVKLEDHKFFPSLNGQFYNDLEISKDFAMSTGAGQDARVFVSHFDQSFSVIPEANTGLATFGIAALAGNCLIRRRSAAKAQA